MPANEPSRYPLPSQPKLNPSNEDLARFASWATFPFVVGVTVSAILFVFR
jgi:hypothetical protein